MESAKNVNKREMLKLNNLSVSVENKEIIKNIDLSLGAGQVMVLFGPNGSGKSTLIKAIMGLGGYEISSGEIVFKDRVINGLATEEKVKLGMGIMYQHPPTIRGVKLSQIARFLCDDQEKIAALAKRMSLEEHLNREINLDFSGGEKKRAELFQLLLHGPDLLLLDEPESGVDLENISLMGKVLDEYLRNKNKSALIITHTGYILDYIKAKYGCILLNGGLWCRGKPAEIFEKIKTGGYEKCKVCNDR